MRQTLIENIYTHSNPLTGSRMTNSAHRWQLDSIKNNVDTKMIFRQHERLYRPNSICLRESPSSDKSTKYVQRLSYLRDKVISNLDNTPTKKLKPYWQWRILQLGKSIKSKNVNYGWCKAPPRLLYSLMSGRESKNATCGRETNRELLVNQKQFPELDETLIWVKSIVTQYKYWKILSRSFSRESKSNDKNFPEYATDSERKSIAAKATNQYVVMTPTTRADVDINY